MAVITAATIHAPSIKALPESVINRIAAGEVIHRPANAIKELLENALDAGASLIQVLIKDGGLSKITIIDNGHGIHMDDLPILCHRFTTSKLKAFEDLKSLTSYGFRGEALASISQVSQFSIVTRTKEAAVAYRASYTTGELDSCKPCAGNQGTQLHIENLFYNCPTRKGVMKSFSEEYAKILNVVSLYAIHNAGVSISCRKEDAAAVDLQTTSSSSTLDNIKCVYGAAIAKELVPIGHEAAYFSFSGYASHSGYHAKRTTFILFINKRWVESKEIKQALLALYSTLLPKKTYPFIYLSIHIRPDYVDVNIHPTKSEVRLLYDDEILQILLREIQSSLARTTSKTFQIQSSTEKKATTSPLPSQSMASQAHTSSSPTSSLSSAQSVAPAATSTAFRPVYSIVRTDPSSQTLDSFEKRPSMQLATSEHHATTKKQRVDVKLQSVLDLRKEVLDTADVALSLMFKCHTLVGLIDSELALLQYQTSLYMVKYAELSVYFFYQRILKEFGNLQSHVLPAAIQVFNPSEPLANVLRLKLMLKEYFSISIDESGNLTELPVLLKNYEPTATVDRLVQWFAELESQVNWIEEKPCLQGIAERLAQLYRFQGVEKQCLYEEDLDEGVPNAEWTSFQRTIEHVFFPALKQDYHFPMSYASCTVHLTDSKDLYKVFERC